MAFDDGVSDIGYRVLYYCTRDERFFELSPIAPLRCPYCFCDPRFIIGPILSKQFDLDKLIREHKRKYGHTWRK